MAERGFLKCLLCNTKSPSKYHLTQHIYQHLSYRKYQCTTCTELFYNEEERELHCKRRGHVHTYEMKVSPYCELYVNQLLKDVEYVAVYGFDPLIMQRSKANLACDVAMTKLPKSPYGIQRCADSPSGHEKTTSSGMMVNQATRSPLNIKRNTGDAIGQDRSSPSISKLKAPSKLKPSKAVGENSGELTTKPSKSTKSAETKEKKAAGDWSKIEVDNGLAISSATHLLGEALRTTPPEVRCTICKTSTPSEYVVRKQHVSSNHMPKDHTESDYVEILSAMMKKAYPTLTYNDLQCQIGGCRKEYKCPSSRRSHVLRTHFQNELSCPLNCSYRSNDFSLLNSHLKEDHGLRNGHMSIDSQHVREQFNTERAKHNYLLNSLVLQAFPCPIPDCYKTNNKTSSIASPGDTVYDVISRIREKSRRFQDAPPNPLRLRSPSSDSDSSSERNEGGEDQIDRNDIASKASNISSSGKTHEYQLQDSAHVSASTTSSSSSDESDRESNSAATAKKRSATMEATGDPPKNPQPENAKRKRAASPSSSSSSPSSSSSTPTNARKAVEKPLNNISTNKQGKENEVGKERLTSKHILSISSSSSSDTSESDDITVVKTVRSPLKDSGKATTRPTVSRITLDDDDEEDDDITYVKSKPGKKTPEKQSQVRTLAISGVSIEGVGVRANTEVVTRSAPPVEVKSRRLAISGVSVPIDKTPKSSFGKSGCSSEGRFATDSDATVDAVQMEKRRELARRKFDLAEQRRAQRASLKKKRISKVKESGNVKVDAHNRIGLKKRNANHLVSSRHNLSKHSASCNDTNEKPSYVVEKFETDSPPPKRSSNRRKVH